MDVRDVGKVSACWSLGEDGLVGECAVGGMHPPRGRQNVANIELSCLGAWGWATVLYICVDLVYSMPFCARLFALCLVFIGAVCHRTNSMICAAISSRSWQTKTLFTLAKFVFDLR